MRIYTIVVLVTRLSRKIFSCFKRCLKYTSKYVHATISEVRPNCRRFTGHDRVTQNVLQE